MENFLRGNDDTFKNPDEWVKYQRKIEMNWSDVNINGRSAYVMNSDGFENIPEKMYTFFVSNINQGYDKYSIILRGESNFSEGEEILATLKFSRK